MIGVAIPALRMSRQTSLPFFFGNITDYNSAQIVNGIPTIAAQKAYLAQHGIFANLSADGKSFATASNTGGGFVWNLRGVRFNALRSVAANRLAAPDVDLLKELARDADLPPEVQRLAKAAECAAMAFGAQPASM